MLKFETSAGVYLSSISFIFGGLFSQRYFLSIVLSYGHRGPSHWIYCSFLYYFLV